jgi:hypothetical protein
MKVKKMATIRLQKMLPYFIGMGASLGLPAFYLGIMTLTSDWYYALSQLNDYLFWIIALSLGFGIQSTLFAMIRRRLKGMDKKSTTSTLAASGGLSTASMVACCLHHVADFVPFLGLPVLAVTVQKYQTIFFLIGVLSNLFGISLMIRMMVKHEMIDIESKWKNFAVVFRRANP